MLTILVRTPSRSRPDPLVKRLSIQKADNTVDRVFANNGGGGAQPITPDNHVDPSPVFHRFTAWTGAYVCLRFNGRMILFGRTNS